MIWGPVGTDETWWELAGTPQAFGCRALVEAGCHAAVAAGLDANASSTEVESEALTPEVGARLFD